MRYLVVIEKTGTGFSAYLPDLAGCVATGRSRAAVEKNIHEAVEFHLEGLRARGLAPDPPTSFATYHAVGGG